MCRNKLTQVAGYSAFCILLCLSISGSQKPLPLLSMNSTTREKRKIIHFSFRLLISLHDNSLDNFESKGELSSKLDNGPPPPLPTTWASQDLLFFSFVLCQVYKSCCIPVDNTMALWLYGLGQLSAISSMCLSQHPKQILVSSIKRICQFSGKRKLRKTVNLLRQDSKFIFFDIVQVQSKLSMIIICSIVVFLNFSQFRVMMNNLCTNKKKRNVKKV